MKRTSLNIIIAFITKLAVILSGIILQRFILVSFGSEINGLTSSVNQFISYFTLLEAGLGTASIQALYLPLARGDKQKVESILSATEIQYRNIGVMFFALILGLSFAMPFISNSTLEIKKIVVITFLMGLSSVINYFFIGKYTVLLNADRRVYVIHNLDAILSIIFSIVRIYMINSGFDIISVQAVALLSPITRGIILYVYVKKIKYKEFSFKVKPDFKATNKRWSVLVHQIVGMINNHVDITLLTIFSTLSHVSVYSVYNYIYNNISALLMQTFQIAPAASFAKLYNSSNKNAFREYYDFFEWGFTMLLFLILSVSLVLTLPFVSLYTASVVDIDYLDIILAFEFAISILFYLIRTPHILINNITGTFKETQNGAVVEAIINLVVSIPMFFIFGIRGLLIGTIIALSYRTVDLLVFAYKNIIYKKYIEFLKLFMINLCAAIIILVLYMIIYPLNINTWAEWLVWAIIVFITATVVFVVFNFIFYKRFFIKSMTIIRSIKK